MIDWYALRVSGDPDAVCTFEAASESEARERHLDFVATYARHKTVGRRVGCVEVVLLDPNGHVITTAISLLFLIEPDASLCPFC